MKRKREKNNVKLTVEPENVIFYMLQKQPNEKRRKWENEILPMRALDYAIYFHFSPTTFV